MKINLKKHAKRTRVLFDECQSHPNLRLMMAPFVQKAEVIEGNAIEGTIEGIKRAESALKAARRHEDSIIKRIKQLFEDSLEEETQDAND